jgi:2-(1,2-epoxy-1,2-dihydrophenyl)acetyl-CoA isomerase
MSYQTIHYDVADGVATISLNRPETLNAFNDTMTAETISAFRDAGSDDAVRCIVLTGQGRGFSSGQDLGGFRERQKEMAVSDHLRKGYNRLVMRMVGVEKPIIGSINGVAAGAGCSIALATDIRIMSDRASFIQAFSRIGLVPDSGSTWFLPRLIGYARAYQMAVTAEKIPAEKALAWGLVNEVSPHEQLHEMTEAWARRLADGPTQAFGMTKRAMHRSMLSSLADSMEYEALLQDIAVKTRDHVEGVSAFLEKRPAVFRGE